ncbi:uncharacterized protein F4817DRAFT_315537 [Daldinia loculata]|uniref:uncharacterized protein n=1 Tax=Daldinia loculata TaxID=103429 RepID=UPI0020C5376A|nr:uncharacterized protein F4817DRAFT_315537 [Daldinia loculata]KAI1647670.1 hypothetical protein F4817DRAFT_315537 [Daldinia loculata]
MQAPVPCITSGMFSPFIQDPNVQLLGVEAGGDGLDTNHHAATLNSGSPGVLHGVKT